MNGYSNEEEIVGKAYDAKLMRRLLRYARPYWAIFAAALVVLMVIAAADLVRPYVIKIAIDEYVTGYENPMARFEPDQVPADVREQHRMHYAGSVFVRSEHLPVEMRHETHYQMLAVAGKYVIIDKVLPPEHGQAELVETAEGAVLHVDSLDYAAEIVDSADAVREFRGRDIEAIGRLALLLLVVGMGAFALNYGQTVTLHYVGQRIVYNIRQEVFTHISHLDLAFFDRSPVGRLVTRLTNDTETLNEMYTSVLVNLFKDVFMLIGIIAVMFRLNTQLALVSMATLPLIALVTVVFRVKARDAYRRVRAALARINAFMAESISGMRVVQIYNREKKKSDEFAEVNRDYYKAGIGEMMVYAVFRPIVELIGTLALSLLVWYGGRRVITGQMPFGLVYAFINYIGMFFGPINDLTEKYNILQAAMASSERMFQLLDTPITVRDPADPIDIGQVRGDIEFKNVWFAYSNDDWVLRDVSFTIKPGEMVAFVGATGAGKTSVISLMNRFYDIQKGAILVDGIDIRRYRVSDLRKNIATVLQEVFLFTGDIKGNIRLNNTDISDEKIREVAHYVNADHFISRLPHGYDEPVTERGSTLSAGQRQLLAFARALAFDPAILVLDEATANIDTETELLIQDALPRLIAGRTTIVVAHRLSTIQHADKIIVLHKGRIREMGTHQELLAHKGIYYDLYRLQYKDDFGLPTPSIRADAYVSDEADQMA
ncbi:MAG TPA: ABC transporter ATP-binding protein [Bacillota bacterium]|mgnify:CR=1 FL=1|jgi:ATP-binding cassette subfamily B protein/subfamily B ATP-binding cassette protein MsbA|nr:ABC transporter ATP-binding protein [Bacillota bacterium]